MVTGGPLKNKYTSDASFEALADSLGQVTVHEADPEEETMTICGNSRDVDEMTASSQDSGISNGTQETVSITDDRLYN